MLAASRASAGTGDRIEVGPGLYLERVVIDKAEDSGLTLHGAGRGPGSGMKGPVNGAFLMSGNSRQIPGGY
jgi:pectin methylesterase-like acyl-CoA thioesterase